MDLLPSLRLERPLGAGGMGAVWVAYHERLRTEVVVKLMAPELRQRTDLRERFTREATAAANVRSPHVVQVFDSGVSEDLGPYIVMEMLHGEDLATHLERHGPLSSEAVARLVAHVAHALDRAHEAGIVHRDVKPANLFLCDDHRDSFFVKVLDFGVAKMRLAEPATATGTTMGTPTYMSPEQAAGVAELGGASDLYSLGLVAFRALTGVPAFTPESFAALALGVYALPLPRLSDRRPTLPLAVDAWFARACARKPADRFGDGATMAEALSDALGVTRGSERALLRAREVSTFVGPRSAGETLPRARGSDSTEASALPVASTRPPSGAGSETASAPAKQSRGRGGVLLAAAACIVALSVGVAARAGLLSFATRAPEQVHAAEGAAPQAHDEATGLAAEPPIPIGVLLDLSGAHRREGGALLEASRAAEALVNASGGIHGRRVALVVRDDQGDRGEFLADAARSLLATPDLRVLVGPLRSGQVAVVAPLAEAAGVIEIAAAATSPALTSLRTPAERLLFRTSPSEAFQARALVALTRGELDASSIRCESMAVLASEDAFGRAFTDVFRPHFEVARGRVVAVALVPQAPKVSYSEEIASFTKARAECEVLAVGPEAAARYLRQRRAVAARSPTQKAPSFFAVSNLATDDLLIYAKDDRRDPRSTSVADGLRGIRPAAMPTWRPEFREFVHLLSAVTPDAGDEVAPFAASQFDAIMLGAIALAKADPGARFAELRTAFRAVSRGGRPYGAADLTALFAALARGEEVSYVGASGDVQVDDDGDVTADLVSWVVDKGQIVESGRVSMRDTR